MSLAATNYCDQRAVQVPISLRPFWHAQSDRPDDAADQRSDRGADISGWRVVYELAGIVGIPDPGHLTLRELDWMAHGAMRERWDRSCELLAAIMNQYTSERITAAQLHPLRRPTKAPLENISLQQVGRLIGIKGIPAEAPGEG